MKVLNISGEDYGALMFSDAHAGTEVNKIIEDIDAYAHEYWELSVHEFEGNVEDIDPNLLEWVRSQIDYDGTKHKYYYFENEKIK